MSTEATAWTRPGALVRAVTSPRSTLEVLAFTVGISILTGILFGLAPALNTLRFDLTPALKSAGLDSTDHRRHRLQNVLIGVQAAVCLVLLINAGLLLRSFRHALTMDDGITNRNVAIAEFDLRQQRYSDDQARRFINTLRDTVALVLDEVTHAEAADVLGVSEGTISWRMSEVKKRLRALKEAENG